MKYSPEVACVFFESEGLPRPELELRFHPERKWRFDFAWNFFEDNPGTNNPDWIRVALEVQGGIWIQGGHNRGAQMLKDYEKYNEAAALGWRILYVQPRDLCTVDTANLIKRCLGL